MSQIIEKAVASRAYNPKTVLGFFAIVLGIVLAASASATLILSRSERTVEYIPFVLAFAGLFILALVALVSTVMIVSPAKLMLTGVSGREFVEIQRLTLGDSMTGKRPVDIILPQPASGETPTVVDEAEERSSDVGTDDDNAQH